MAKRRKAGRPRGRVGLSGVSIAAMQAEIERRQSSAGKLLKKRDRLAAQLAAVEAKLADAGIESGGAASTAAPARGGGRRTRAKNSLTLVEALEKLLKGRTMSVTDASEAVQKAGYATNSPNFRTIVNQALLKFKDKFKKQGRGQYTAA